MKHTEFAIDVNASGKDEMKKVRNYLRSKGYSVCKRKNNPEEKGIINYLSARHPRCNLAINTHDFYYYGYAGLEELLTPPRDWKKFVDYVEPEVKTQRIEIDATGIREAVQAISYAYKCKTEKKREPKIGDWVVVLKSAHTSHEGKTYKIIDEDDTYLIVYIDEDKTYWRKKNGIRLISECFRFATPEEIAVAENPAPKLETGMLVECEIGFIYLIINNSMVSSSGFNKLSDWGDDLKCVKNTDDAFNIIRVSKVLSNNLLPSCNWTKETLKANLLWERK